MSRKSEILSKIRENIGQTYEMPILDFEPTSYENRIAQFSKVVEQVGGQVVELKSSESVEQIIQRLYPSVEVIASSMAEVGCATVNPDNVDAPHELNGVELAVVAGAFGVAENGCVWSPQSTAQKATYFIAEYLMLVIDKYAIVDNMHQAYERLEMNDYGFGVFISGPSKTADIEQALVIGAHGARGVTIVLR